MPSSTNVASPWPESAVIAKAEAFSDAGTMLETGQVRVIYLPDTDEVAIAIAKPSAALKSWVLKELGLDGKPSLMRWDRDSSAEVPCNSRSVATLGVMWPAREGQAFGNLGPAQYHRLADGLVGDLLVQFRERDPEKRGATAAPAVTADSSTPAAVSASDL